MITNARKFITLLLQALATLFLFIPGMFVRCYWRTGTIGWTLRGEYYTSVIGKSEYLAGFWGWLLVIIMLVGCALLIYQLMTRKKWKSWQNFVVPAAQILVFVVFSACVETEHTSTQNFYEFGLGFLWYIELALLLGIVAMTVLDLRAPEEVPAVAPAVAPTAEPVTPIPQPTPRPVAPRENADDLVKYKQLLDMGVITQEEFDAKKREILGL